MEKEKIITHAIKNKEKNVTFNNRHFSLKKFVNLELEQIMDPYL